MSSREQYKTYVTDLKKELKDVRTLNQGLLDTIKADRKKQLKQREEIVRLYKALKKAKSWYQIIIRI